MGLLHVPPMSLPSRERWGSPAMPHTALHVRAMADRPNVRDSLGPMLEGQVTLSWSQLWDQSAQPLSAVLGELWELWEGECGDLGVLLRNPKSLCPSTRAAGVYPERVLGRCCWEWHSWGTGLCRCPDHVHLDETVSLNISLFNKS